jgi:hypothetical protein
MSKAYALSLTRSFARVGRPSTRTEQLRNRWLRGIQATREQRANFCDRSRRSAGRVDPTRRSGRGDYPYSRRRCGRVSDSGADEGDCRTGGTPRAAGSRPAVRISARRARSVGSKKSGLPLRRERAPGGIVARIERSEIRVPFHDTAGPGFRMRSIRATDSSRAPHAPFAFTQLSRRPTVRLKTRRPGLLSGSRMK